MPLDWNQINQDDSSVSGYQSSHDDDLPQIPAIKTLSQLTSPKSLTAKSSAHDVVAQNLQKLSMIDSQQVWLFAPKPNKNDQTENIASHLKGHQKFKKVLPNSAGWNILVSKKQEAKQLILNGYKKEKFTFRFYVSTKNQELNTQNPIRKSSTQNIDDNKSFDTPHKLRKLHHEQQYNKKKIKYQQKVSDKKLPPRPRSVEKVSQNQIKQNDPKHQAENKKIEQKQIQLSKSSEIAETQKESEIHIDVQNKAIDQDERSQSEDEQEMKADKQVSSPQQEGEEEYDSEESLERMRKAIKRKNKKLNKKKAGSKQTDSVDKNNPFSLLA